MADTRARAGLRLTASVGAWAEVDGGPSTIAAAIVEVIPDTCILTLRSGTTVFDRDASVLQKLAGATASAIVDRISAPVLEPRLEPSTELLRSIGARGLIAVPVRSRDEVTGVLAVIRHRPEHAPLDELDLAILENVASQTALALANARLHAELVWRMTEPRRVDDRALFLDAIVENIPDMVFVKDAERLAFVRLNRAGEELLGMRREELIGKTDFDFFPEEAQFFVKKDRETLASKALVDIPEESIQTRRGTRWLHTKKVPLVDAMGTPRYLLGISHDITARKHTETRLSAAKDEAESASRELETFASSVAQDLRAPLREIIGLGEVLAGDHLEQLDERGRGHLRRLAECATTMSSLLEGRLELSRASRVELHREPTDLAALARATMATLKRADPARRAELVIARELVAECDARLVTIVLEQLLGNAWKFTSKRSHARIEVGSQRRRDATVFFVRDDGAGFDMADADRLFKPFQHLHAETALMGTGVGLATVDRIVRRHRGRVWAEGHVDHGATFYFTLGAPEP